MKPWLRVSLILLPFLVAIGFFAYTSIDIWFIEEEVPESYIAQGDCTYDEYGNAVACHASYEVEELCHYPELYYNEYGEPYYETMWDYCSVVNWEDPDALTIPFVDYEVDSKLVGATTTGAVPILGKFAISAVTGKGKMKRAIKEALKEQMNGP